jgi:CubicO group peptidase (beta-lactamase class C family)
VRDGDRWRRIGAVSVLLVLASCADDELSPPSSTTPSVASSTASEPSASPASLDEVAARLQQQIDARVADGGYPGAVVLVDFGGEEQGVVGGQSRVDPATSTRPQDTFAIASITKPLVATAVLRLVEQGRLSRTTPLRSCSRDSCPVVTASPSSTC